MTKENFTKISVGQHITISGLPGVVSTKHESLDIEPSITIRMEGFDVSAAREIRIFPGNPIVSLIEVA